MKEYPRPNKELIENAPEIVIYNGKKFKKRRDGRYYNGKSALSRVVWETEVGKIPDGCEIHHKDRNPTNNDISNLQCLTEAEHKEIHRQLLSEDERQWSRDNLKEKAGPKAVEWHKSEAGHKWHTANTRHQHEIGAFTHNLICSNCGKEYIGQIYSHNTPHFCSGRCKTAYRRKSGVDNELRICQYCGKEFMTNKRKGAKTCSKECRYKLLSVTLSKGSHND